MLGPVYLLKADDLLLNVLIKLLFDHGWFEIDSFLNSKILLAGNHEHSTFKLGVQVEALKWPFALDLRTLLPSEVFNLLFPHPKIIGDHLLLNVFIFKTKSIINATKWIDYALAVSVCHSHILILVVS